ncbi:MAG: hypothetical protein PHO66_05440 [Eubacteriales bacterium]|nr:hypothetical protein [Eubacteriales bacterium]
MSFYSYKNANANLCPGNIAETEGFRCCERICVQVKRVYDACLEQTQTDRIVTVTNITPSNPVPVAPLTLVSCRSTSVTGEVHDLMIDRLPDRPQFARVRCCIRIPIEVVFTDGTNREYVGQAYIIVKKDVVLCVPDNSLVPFDLQTIVNAICVTGYHVRNWEFNISVCISIILKIVADVDILLPSYGFCPIPPCESFAESVCDEFFNLPLYPQQTCSFPCN